MVHQLVWKINLIWMTGKYIHTMRCIIIHSSLCVLNFMLPACRPNFCRNCSHIKRWAGLVYGICCADDILRRYIMFSGRYYPCFRGICCFQLQGRSSTLMMEVAASCERSIHRYQTTWRHIPLGCYLIPLMGLLTLCGKATPCNVRVW